MGLNVNLQEAIELFEGDRRGKFSQDDLAAIREVVEEFGLCEFQMSTSPSKKYRMYFRDSADLVHVHPTMILSRKHFSSARDQPSKFEYFPFQRDLENWIHKKGNSGRPLCLDCGIELPVVLRCDYCGYSPNDDEHY